MQRLILNVVADFEIISCKVKINIDNNPLCELEFKDWK